MKTERRHELQTNRLADWLGHQLERLRPHGKKLIGAGILGAAVIVTVVLITKDREVALEAAQNDFYIALAARDRDALENVAKTHEGTVVALWAKQAQADIDLENGLRALYTNRDEAYRSLEDAKDSYNDVVNAGGSHPELLQHSLMGLAQVNEATSNLEKSREYYERVAQQFAETPIALLAKSRLETIDDPQIAKWYNWFGRQKPKPPAPRVPGGIPGLPDMPDDLSTLPDKPDLPIFTSGDKPAGEQKSTDAAKEAAPTGSPEPPATPETPGTSEAPTTPETSDGSSAPATSEQPADKPAESSSTNSPDSSNDASAASPEPGSTPDKSTP